MKKHETSTPASLHHLMVQQMKPYFSNAFKRDDTIDTQKLDGMLSKFKKKNHEIKKEKKGKDHHILDSYIQVLTYLH